jgi:hypothetical protein
MNDPVFNERMNSANEASRRAGRLIDAMRFQDAYDFWKDFYKVRPDLMGLTRINMAKCATLVGRYDEAYSLLVQLVSHRSTANDERYTELSLASAARGEVYPGQLEFLLERLREYYWEQHPSTPLELDFQPQNDSRSIMVLSSLALGMRIQPEYLELTRRLDPKNTLAAEQAIEFYGYTGWHSRIRRIATNIASRLSPGPKKDWFLKQAALSEGKVDGTIDD